MTCEEHQLRLSKLLDDALAKDQQQALFLHLGECAECRAFFSTSMHLRAKMRSAPPIPMEYTNPAGPLNPAMHSTDMISSLPIAHKSGRLTARTFALALLLLIVGCLMFSTTMTIDTRGLSATPSAIQPRPGNNNR